MKSLLLQDQVIGIPNLNFKQDSLCGSCQKGKQAKNAFRTKTNQSTDGILQLLHMDLFESSKRSIGGSKYGLVVIDDFSRFTWVVFLRTKDRTRDSLIKLITQVELESAQKVKMIRSDRGTEFLNQGMTEFCEGKGIKHQTSAARTPQQNGVVERKNRMLKAAA